MAELLDVPGHGLLPLRRMAARLGVPSGWLREQAEAGRVPGLRAGDRWLFLPDITTAAVRSMAGDAFADLIVKRPEGEPIDATP